ncbi:MORN repeat-containing protein 4 homolog [Tribolium madens]|uniref:MORN repeat-containing protein 4 homolog n=1 Tax=Tribolium madens TaxID=41895 RepID=UPI001CF733A6|nr:MORN repeat-containing protein 4 homolog [Tribolium madens]
MEGVAKIGGFRYENGAVYVGSWNKDGRRHGYGHLKFRNGNRYDGFFEDGLFHGLGMLTFSDGAKYEGEFTDGWFHGYGIFWRADGMRHEGQFCGGKMWGLGLTTFKDGSNGFPRYEGFFQDCKILKTIKCPEAVQKAQKIAFMARNYKE